MPGRANLATKQLVQQILACGQITRQQHLHLTSALLATNQLSEDDRTHINRLLDSLQIGRLKFSD